MFQTPLLPSDVKAQKKKIFFSGQILSLILNQLSPSKPLISVNFVSLRITSATNSHSHSVKLNISNPHDLPVSLWLCYQKFDCPTVRSPYTVIRIRHLPISSFWSPPLEIWPFKRFRDYKKWKQNLIRAEESGILNQMSYQSSIHMDLR